VIIFAAISRAGMQLFRWQHRKQLLDASMFRHLLSSSFPLPPSTFTSPAKLIATTPPPPNCSRAQHRLILALRLNPLVPPLSTAISRTRHFRRNESAMTTVT
jgi:hypothetical protein